MKMIKNAMSVLALVCALFVTSCSDEPASVTKFNPVKKGEMVQGKVDFEVLSRYEAALEDATYTCVDFSLYRKDDLTAGKWELDTDEYVGFESSIPTPIVMRDGKVWNPIELFSSSTGPTAFATALSAVNTTLGKEYKVYAVRPFAVNAEDYTLTLDGRKYGILSADDTSLILSYVSKYYGGRTGNGGEDLEVGFYEKSAPLQFNDGKDLGFDSVVEAYDWLIELFRDTFGEKVNLNDIYAPHVYLDNPDFYLERLEQERDRYAKMNK